MPDPVMRDWKAILANNVRELCQQKKLILGQLAFEAEIDLTHMGGIEVRLNVSSGTLSQRRVTVSE